MDYWDLLTGTDEIILKTDDPAISFLPYESEEGKHRINSNIFDDLS